LRARAWHSAALLLAVLTLTCAAGASAQYSEQPPGYVPGSTTLPTSIAARLPDGSALAPPDAPFAVQNAIRAANRIRKRPYIWGGGHRRWKSRGYDCSGAVSYVLHAAGLLTRPLVSGSLARSWGAPGLGAWITVYANRAHTFIVIAGLPSS
jgi:cell wall-associated NlpC family hydrolase